VKRLDYTQPISYWSRYLCCCFTCMGHKRRPTHCAPVATSRQCRITTNVHWRNSLVGFRWFTPQMKIQSHGSASSAYARRRFRTSNIELVRNCQSYYGFNLPSELWSNRVKKFNMLNMPPAGAALWIMVTMSHRFLMLVLFWLSFYSCIDAVSISDEWRKWRCTGWSKKAVLQFYFCDNFHKCTPILIIYRYAW